VDQLRRNRLVAQVIRSRWATTSAAFASLGTEPALIEHYGCTLGGWRALDGTDAGGDRVEVARVTKLAVAACSAARTAGAGGAVHEESRYEVVGVLAPTAPCSTGCPRDKA